MKKGAITLVLMAIMLVNGCSKDTSEAIAARDIIRPAKILMAESFNKSGKRVYPGRVEASSKSDLAFRVGGQLKELHAVAGKRFKKGEILAALDESDYRNTLDDREAKYKFARSQFEKISELRKENYTSPTNVDEAEANLKEAEAALAIARDNLAYTQLVAPFNGIVAQVNIENYQVVNANQTVLQLNGDDSLDIRFSVPESLFGQVRKIEPNEGESICAVVRFNAYPEKSYKACFKEFESIPDRLTSSYSVVHSMPQIEDFRVLPGMAVSVELDLSFILKNDERGGVLVPLEAVFEEGETTWIWTIDSDMRVHKTRVAVSKIEGAKLLVTEGLTAGDSFVAAGVSFLQEDMQVKPLAKERGL
ncbi:efflux RND transporter periplasmic adaptor subunit [Agarilytica rhodophyticola]|uniref:efflux RND transporter periplasmic adaptor subunit n=1 Tax=Agarilytica rhodophyticola TaxID=1737490 RepID=UPI000B349184|nr:efflux RND transporter periplasmic adaptor subunit [Agarilytica rhodophyticola]